MTVAGETIDARATLTMTVYAPSHLHRGYSLNLRHLRDLSVTLLARYARFHVTLVVKL